MVNGLRGAGLTKETIMPTQMYYLQISWNISQEKSWTTEVFFSWKILQQADLYTDLSSALAWTRFYFNSHPTSGIPMFSPEPTKKFTIVGCILQYPYYIQKIQEKFPQIEMIKANKPKENISKAYE